MEEVMQQRIARPMPRSGKMPDHGPSEKAQDSLPTIYGAVCGAVNAIRTAHGILDQIEQSINPTSAKNGDMDKSESMGGLVSVTDDARESADYLVKRLQSLRELIGG